MNDKPTKRVAVVDTGPSKKAAMGVLQFVDDLYDFEFTPAADADYVFHSCFGYDVLKYAGVRIFVTGENVSPNFNISDYAMAFDRMEFGDRYCWLPLIKLYREAYASLTAPRPPANEILPTKTGFCAYVMSSTRDSAPERTTVFEALSRYKPVSSGGKWNNNVGGPVPKKLAFQSSHKFVLAIENCSYPGYLTEKFSEAAQANAVPIYWGDPTIADLFNPKAFVNCHDYGTLDEVVARVKEIDSNDDLYRQMLSEPWFPGGIEPECLRDETYARFLRHIFDQDHEAAYRRNRGRWGIKQEKNLRRMYDQPLNHGIRRLRTKWLDLYHRVIPRKTYQG